MGPLISSAHRNKVLGYIDRKRKAKLRVDGRGFSVKGHEQGYFVGPTLFDNVTPEMTIYKEEIFGPVLSVVRVADYASAVDLINRHEYGNGSAIFTRDGGCARRFCEEVQAGMVGVNVPIRCRWHSTASAAGSALFWRAQRSRQRRRALLHPNENHHRALAGNAAGDRRCVLHADAGLTGGFMQTERMTMAQALVRFLNQQYVSVDGDETPFVEGVATIFGHGNVLGIGQALEQDRAICR